ncbi:Cysteine synthase [Thermoanaerobacter thermohydrosulfuricus WC1]|uniref:Cysteine synthase n=1 Tax=Thermoanaerobacter thermohydrosulfuricus WC1 TaxID=1198630 RepID=M8D0X8_THETY|nr:2-amino-4-oxopentanoate thiolase subunit OrtB [Thermoanaerobacter thermohydrosulfuricus]EMT40229.1 Cysteine synthase [Thermoanaerobacter thermohydrosulfuricus WC1]SFE24101.1 Cysteine synthase [Thermoanaerobacter thermohydrosulfuricus]
MSRYKEVMARKNEIMKKSLGIDYERFESGGIAFDYERMMKETGYTLEEIIKIQREANVGDTPLIELKNLTELARKVSPTGKAARIFIKDEACNPSGSFKERRASVSIYHAKQKGYKGVIAATSGNYGAAVASQAAMIGLKCIVVQEAYDSRGIGQPEILEKGRKCETFGAEVIQLTVGPELFYVNLMLLEETGYFNASLYTPFGVAGIETLGYEIAQQVKERTGKFPDVVVATHAGGGNLTGTARGLIKAGATHTKVYGASVDLTGLHMASDKDFNRKSFTTGHTGFGIPFATWPDRADVPRNAARPLRYMDGYYLVKQGEVFYMTELLAQLEGLERGPAGNTSLAAAFSLAQQMENDQIIVVQETEYTGAGKNPTAQLTFAMQNGIKILVGNPDDEIPGQNIILPEHPSMIKAREVNLSNLKKSYIKNCVQHFGIMPKEEDIKFLAEDTKSSEEFVKEVISELQNGGLV